MALSTLVINIAYIALFASTFTRRLVWLRAFLIAGSVAFITFGIMVGNWSMVGWNIVTGSLHARQLVLYVLSRRRLSLTAEDEVVRRTLFPDLDAFDFSSLWSMGETVRYVDELMTVRGETHGRVGVVLDGTVRIERPADADVELTSGALVGELTYVRGGAATADARAIGTVTLREWPHDRLATLDQLNPAAGRALHRFLERDIAAKVG